MIKNYFKTTLRYLWRHRLFTALNVLGLAIGISACWVIYRVVDYEFSYERKLPNKENTYRLITGFVWDEKESYNGGVSAPIYQAVREQVTGLELVVPIFDQWINIVELPQQGEKPLVFEEQTGVVATDSAYFELVPYTWLAGSKSSAFAMPENVVLTQSRAVAYFPNLDPEAVLGKTITYNDTLQKTVSGIVRDLDYNTEFVGKEFVYLKPKAYALNTWTNTNGSDKLYLQAAASADTAKVMAQITSIVEQKWQEFKQEQKPTYTFTRWYELLPVTESHFFTQINDHLVRRASKPVLYGLMGIGGFLLLLACINYINLSTAQMPQRNKEIGVRKTLGSSRKQLFGQIFGETAITVLLAVVLATILSTLVFALLGDIIPEGTLEYRSGIGFILFLAALMLFVTALAGWYPAWLVARVKPVSIMRGHSSSISGKSKFTLRKALIVSQFVIAQVFIIGALIVGQQLHYTLKKDMGFDKEAVVLVTVPWKIQREEAYKGKQLTLADELRKESGIQQLSLGTEPMTNSYSSSQYEYSGDAESDPIKRQVFRKSVDTNYLSLYDMELLAGRNIRASDTTNEFVINETAAKVFGFRTPQEAVGKALAQSGQQPIPIVGVVKDFHMRDFYTTIDPVALMADNRNLGTLNIKLNTADPGQWEQTIKRIEEKWYEFYPPETFALKFYDETLEEMYTQERNLSKLINLATTIAIIISCLGLFGLATLTAFQRTKEIGVRKVLGATVSGIVALLSKDFVKLVIVAIVIASPIAWWAMNKWLEDFAYRIDIEWWMFAVAGLGAVIIALLTVASQAIKAAVANPVESLRDE